MYKGSPETCSDDALFVVGNLQEVVNGDRISWTGEVNNTSDVYVYALYIVIVFYDRHGNLVAGIHASANNIRAHDTIPFKSNYSRETDTFPSYTSMEAFVNHIF